LITLKTKRTKKYYITISNDLRKKLIPFLEENYSQSRAMLLIDENVKLYHGQRIAGILGEYFKLVKEYVIPSGESSKSYEEWQKITEFALQNNVRRSTPLFAVGGGVTGDLSGFAAASIMRGIPLVHIPTTLLSMVDSSIGGKTGINSRTGKNLIGAFYQPDAVFADVTMLQTLPREEWLCGLGEVIKYGAISDRKIIDEVKDRLKSGSMTEYPDLWVPLINKCASIKADIVEKDEKEAGIRAYLNFGHTFAHAIEAYLNYDEISHGAAVYAGMIAAAFASNYFGAELELEELLQFKSYYNLNLSRLEKHIGQLIEIMYHDKKVKSDKLRLILLSDWEQPYITDIDDMRVVRDSWKYMFRQL